MPKVAFTTLGCKVNQYETDAAHGLFLARGYDIVPFDSEADVYVINTCSVTHLGERKSRQSIRRAVRANPNAVVAVMGCFAQLAPDQIRAIPGVDVVIGTNERHRIVELVEEARQSGNGVTAVNSIMEMRDFEDIPLLALPGHTRAYIKIQEGCTNFCTYCIIPYARGPLRSRSIPSIVAEARKLATAGFREVVLTGIHLGAYGRDGSEGLTLTDVVRALLDVPDLTRIRLSSLESIEVSAGLIELMQDDERVCRHLHLPLQAGDDRILAAMRRHYTTDEYRRLLDDIACKVPDIAYSTDLITGFPGETDEMFKNSLAFVETLDYARMHIFPYSKRSGTPAASFPDQVPEPVKRERVRIWQHLAAEKALDYAARFIGRTLPVLFETEKYGVVDGLTGNYIRVYAEGEASLCGQILPVSLVESYQDGIRGRLIR